MSIQVYEGDGTHPDDHPDGHPYGVVRFIERLRKNNWEFAGWLGTYSNGMPGWFLSEQEMVWYGTMAEAARQAQRWQNSNPHWRVKAIRRPPVERVLDEILYEPDVV